MTIISFSRLKFQRHSMLGHAYVGVHAKVYLAMLGLCTVVLNIVMYTMLSILTSSLNYLQIIVMCSIFLFVHSYMKTRQNPMKYARKIIKCHAIYATKGSQLCSFTWFITWAFIIISICLIKAPNLFSILEELVACTLLTFADFFITCLSPMAC